eukprot:5439369-Pleurochrysis_carterae.AAC.1
MKILEKIVFYKFVGGSKSVLRMSRAVNVSLRLICARSKLQSQLRFLVSGTDAMRLAAWDGDE